jgi:carboxymethylenebutenolidase
MPTTEIEIKTADGTVDTHFVLPDGAGPWPAAIFYMDGLGIRPVLVEMAERLAGNGYAVLLPNLYYRFGKAQPIDFMADRDRMMEMVASVTNQAIVSDTRAFLDFLDMQQSVEGPKLGAVGYCMGGALALTVAANFPERFAAAASFHGARLATDAPDSPHRQAARMQGEIYVGVAEIDPYLTEGETERVDVALREAGTRSTVEIYPDVRHGFAVPGLEVYDRAASERHWDRLLDLFARTLG